MVFVYSYRFGEYGGVLTRGENGMKKHTTPIIELVTVFGSFAVGESGGGEVVQETGLGG